MATVQELLVRFKGNTKGLTDATKKAEFAVNRFGNKVKRVAIKVKASFSGMQGAVLGLGLALGTQRLGKSIINAALSMEQLDSQMIAALGSAGDITGEIKRLRKEADVLGVNFEVSAKNFAQFAAAGRAAGLNLDTVREVFTETTKAGKAMNLTNDQLSGTFTALTQIASKGVVSMEELRQQLGERVPIAMAAMANGLGINVKALDKLVSSGNLAADRGLKALAKGFRENKDLADAFAKAAGSTQSKIARMENSLFDLRKELSKAGVMDAFKESVEALGSALKDPSVIEGLKLFVKGISSLVKIALQAFGIFSKLTDKIAEQFDPIIQKEKELIHWEKSRATIAKITFGLIKNAHSERIKGLKEELKWIHQVQKTEEDKKNKIPVVGGGMIFPTRRPTDINKQSDKAKEGLEKVKTATTGVKNEFSDMNKASNNAFNGLLKDIARGENALDSLRSVARNVLNDIINNVFSGASGGGGGLGGLIGGAISGVAGNVFSGFFGSNDITASSGVTPYAGNNITAKFATGGQFTVGGRGGTDSNMVQFRATAGERVSIETPAQQKANGGKMGATVQVVQNLNFSTGVSQTVRAEVMGMLPLIEQQTLSAVQDAQQRGKM